MGVSTPRIGNRLQALTGTHVRFAGRALPAYQFFGYVGFALAVPLSFTLVGVQRLSYAAMAMVVAAAVLAVIGQAIVTTLVHGEEDLVYYRHVLAVTVVAGVILWALGEAPLPYLDATIVGIGLVGAGGRVGCFMVGCCHGRPHEHGVAYGASHTTAGFPAYLVGVRLFPIQLIEAAWLLGIVLAGSVIVARHEVAGTALAFWAVAYAGGRFVFESMRADLARHYVWRLSEAQWTSLAVAAAVVGAEVLGWMPVRWWHAAVLAGLTGAAITLVWTRQFARHPRVSRSVGRTTS